ncbi:hypothetical protein NFC81_00825 [Salinispirillum sp. LH 10-3-1]|uniref:DUF4034 domain-containing protein n=1 Tax=Salinispirillum sp. LH 10-3-1 TaxID=2952525 RepID=A0AB38YG46_9GAMM
MKFRLLFAVSSLTAVALIIAIWLTVTTPPSPEATIAPPPRTEGITTPSTPATPIPSTAREPLIQQHEPFDAAPDVQEAPATAALGDWLDPYFDISDPLDRDAITALLQVTETMDFSVFWQQLAPLANDGNEFARYLALAFRDWLPLDATLLEFGFVEEPYLNQTRRSHRSGNWLHWLFANWQTSWQPDPDQVRRAYERALAGDPAAQTLIISQTRWFRNNPDISSNLDEILTGLSGNPYLQLLGILQLHGQMRGDDQTTQAQLASLRRSRHPLAQWISSLPDGTASPQQRRAQLLALAQDGYLTAIQEVRALAIHGEGRWTRQEVTPISVTDALTVYQQLMSTQPDNPVVSVALCELYLAQGDYQASWQYMRKLAYEDAFAEEVEDISCWPGNDQAYGDLLIQRGVITQAQWNEHVTVIEGRRDRIRQGQRQ